MIILANALYISQAPLIAALDAKIDIIDTEVDAIRAVDVPTLDALITTVDTQVDGIRTFDIPALDAQNVILDTEIGVIDGIVDAIKIKTDATPQNVRGTVTVYHIQTNANTYQTFCDITGHGKLISLVVKDDNNLDNLDIKLTIDGLAFDALTHTGDLIIQRIFLADNFVSTTVPKIELKPFVSTDANDLNIEFSTSLLVQIKNNDNWIVGVQAKAIVQVDPF